MNIIFTLLAMILLGGILAIVWAFPKLVGMTVAVFVLAMAFLVVSYEVGQLMKQLWQSYRGDIKHMIKKEKEHI